MSKIEENKQRLLSAAKQIESNIQDALTENARLREENARLSDELSALLERLDVYSYELEGIRKQHANTHS